MEGARLSRRTLLAAGAAAAGAGAFAGVSKPAAAKPTPVTAGAADSLQGAQAYLQQVLEAHHASGPRLVQSFSDEAGLGDVGYVYDNALAAIALVARGDAGRAAAIGDALIYAQTHDPEFTDGRLRRSYHARTFVDAATGSVQLTGAGTSVGDLAWVGIAWAQLAHRARQPRFLQAALRVAAWIEQNARSTGRLGGYLVDGSGTPYTSTEHNIDLYAFFLLLARLTGDAAWRERAAWAWGFVAHAWNADQGFFWTGSDDGEKPNTDPRQLPLDVQTWSWLAARKPGFASALDWALGNLATTDTPTRTNSALTGNQTVTGVAFGSGSLRADVDRAIGDQPSSLRPDTGAVWFEGNGQLALALTSRGRTGDAPAADRLLTAIRWAQQSLGRGQLVGGRRIEGGIVAASSPMDTGFGFGYFPHLHVGATAWYVLAAARINPYLLP